MELKLAIVVAVGLPLFCSFVSALEYCNLFKECLGDKDETPLECLMQSIVNLQCIDTSCMGDKDECMEFKPCLEGNKKERFKCLIISETFIDCLDIECQKKSEGTVDIDIWKLLPKKRDNADKDNKNVQIKRKTKKRCVKKVKKCVKSKKPKQEL